MYIQGREENWFSGVSFQLATLSMRCQSKINLPVKPVKIYIKYYGEYLKWFYSKRLQTESWKSSSNII